MKSLKKFTFHSVFNSETGSPRFSNLHLGIPYNTNNVFRSLQTLSGSIAKLPVSPMEFKYNYLISRKISEESEIYSLKSHLRWTIILLFFFLTITN